jgi:tetratricopeptide (TPR) repeat protein
MADEGGTFEVAVQKFHEGDLASAEKICRALLAKDENNSEACHLLSVIAHRVGDNVAALSFAEKASAAQPENSVYLNTQGFVLRLLGRYGESIQKLKEAIARKPDYADAYNNLGIALADGNDLTNAEQAYRKALECKPDFAEVLNNLGNILYKGGRRDEAMAIYQDAIRVKPDYAEAYCNLGDGFANQNQHKEGAEAYQKALEIAPNWADAWYKFGNSLFRLNQLEPSIQAYQRCLDINPRHTRCLTNIGATYEKMSRYDEAALMIRQALIIAPEDLTALKNLGHVLLKLGQPAEGMQLLMKAVQIAPADPDAHYTLGNSLLRMEKLQDAMNCYMRVRQLQPAGARGYFAPASVLLLNGQYKEGWAAYESRFDMAAFKPNVPNIQERLWDGSPLNGRDLLVHVEQGFGDTIQFIRYLPKIAKENRGTGGLIKLLCEPELYRIIQSVEGYDEIYQLNSGDQVTFDVQVPLLSLPARTGTTLETIPNETPYLKAPETKHDPIRRPEGTKLAVGIVWAGRPTHSDDRYRSIPFGWFSSLVDVPGVHFYSIQWGGRSQEAKGLAEQGRLTDLSDRLTDFGETAAIIDQLDLVIACDTSVAHLAGALGKPVWVLMAYGGEWRWLMNREDTPWYPTMRLFRQRICGDWRNVFIRVKNALSEFTAQMGSEGIPVSAGSAEPSEQVITDETRDASQPSAPNAESLDATSDDQAASTKQDKKPSRKSKAKNPEAPAAPQKETGSAKAGEAQSAKKRDAEKSDAVSATEDKGKPGKKRKRRSWLRK